MFDEQTRDLELQRLIDGRMPEAERAAFLDCLDDEPAQWRGVALAYVEDQVLKAELSANDVADVRPAVATSQRPGGVSLLAMAAAVVVALFVGAATGRLLNPQEPVVQPPANQIVEETPTTVTPAVDDDGYYVLLKPEVKQPQPEPEISPWEYVTTSLQEPVIGPDTRETIRQHGYEVRERPVLFVLEDDNGGHYMIPRRHITFVSQQD